jgi:hypothetical protein
MALIGHAREAESRAQLRILALESAPLRSLNWKPSSHGAAAPLPAGMGPASWMVALRRPSAETYE